MRAELEAALGTCKFTDKCNCTIINSFESESAPVFYLFDEGGESGRPVRIVPKDHDFQLTVNNPNIREIHLAKLDKCLIDNDISKCECLLFDTSRLFFVEIKTSSSGTRRNKRKKAREQLGNTINLLRQRGVDFNHYQAKAVICFKQTEPRITNSSENTARATFLQQHRVELEERNYVDF